MLKFLHIASNIFIIIALLLLPTTPLLAEPRKITNERAKPLPAPPLTMPKPIRNKNITDEALDKIPALGLSNIAAMANPPYTGLKINSDVFKAQGEMIFEYSDSKQYFPVGDKLNADKIKNVAMLRSRLQFSFVQSEQLQSLLELEIFSNFNQENVPFEPSTIGLRQFYVNFTNTSGNIYMRTGKQVFSLPQEFSDSPIFSDPLVAVAFGASHESIAVTASVAMLWDDEIKVDEYDATCSTFLNLSLPIKVNNASIIPFVTYFDGKKGYPLGASSYLWMGIAFKEHLLDPIEFEGDVLYGFGTTDRDSTPTVGNGFWVDFALRYTKSNYITPEIFVVYSDGIYYNSDRDKNNRKVKEWGFMGVNNQFKAPTSFLGGSSFSLSDESLEGTYGYLLLGAALKDIRYLDISHDLIFSYVKGTNQYEEGANFGEYIPYINNREFSRLGTDDSLIAVDFNTRYHLNKTSFIALEIAYGLFKFAHTQAPYDKFTNIYAAIGVVTRF